MTQTCSINHQNQLHWDNRTEEYFESHKTNTGMSHISLEHKIPPVHSCFIGVSQARQRNPCGVCFWNLERKRGWIDANATRSSSPFNMWRCENVSAPSSRLRIVFPSLLQDENHPYFHPDCDGVFGFHIIILFATQTISTSR